ncbi:DUF3472 domain-containing protein [Pedobacter flavus]|uniref:DUF3472 domain-containing protein n=1 Tax=Pedobacter flavus TaxID=3113906 RepID=A0ABU7H0Q5_9SPHI|nr:DUF3472 domain-containing protein [Pedobacter sp. VNH31]MEE1884672.1 DUF3472 domain-containing protein [Pedobacter sp. VNH31]
MKKIGLFIIVSLVSIVVNAQSIVFPLGGNAFSNLKDSKTITKSGIQNWIKQEEFFNLYIRTTTKGLLSIDFSNFPVKDEAVLSFKINGVVKTIELKKGGTMPKVLTWGNLDTGYLKIELHGIKKFGNQFPAIEHLNLSGSALNGHPAFVKNNEGNMFYWGRRGPSVHLTYPLPNNFNATYFYNEITVPVGEDVIGSYYMANGFAEGYFGIQVNSETERRILFSVWSPFNTDDPKSIPEDQKIKMLKKGKDVYTGEFGNEGSGGQSFLKYNWKAGNTYKFLLKGETGVDSTTTYTAWFFPPELGEWQLIASFKRPKTSTYLKRFHSFLENFIPETGNIRRKVEFNNQWVADAKGNWVELTQARFSMDNTARSKFRMDYAGGKSGEGYYLENCGFFNEYTNAGSVFSRIPSNKQPLINLKSLE